MKEITCPRGKSGVSVEAWGETYAVCADWAQASDTVLEWIAPRGAWVPTQYQVADSRHWPEHALRRCLEDVVSSGGDTIDDDELDEIMHGAVDIRPAVEQDDE